MMNDFERYEERLKWAFIGLAVVCTAATLWLAFWLIFCCFVSDKCEAAGVCRGLFFCLPLPLPLPRKGGVS